MILSTLHFIRSGSDDTDNTFSLVYKKLLTCLQYFETDCSITSTHCFEGHLTNIDKMSAD